MDQQSPDKTGSNNFATLELPSMTPGSLLRNFGPGMMLMMTGIGTSHLVTAPVAGGRYGYALLWCLPIAYIFKYYGFEMAIRFTHATGRSMLDAYATAWKKIPVWYVLVTTIIQSAVGQAGRLIAAAAVVFYFFRTYLGVDNRGSMTTKNWLYMVSCSASCLLLLFCEAATQWSNLSPRLRLEYSSCARLPSLPWNRHP